MLRPARHLYNLGVWKLDLLRDFARRARAPKPQLASIAVPPSEDRSIECEGRDMPAAACNMMHAHVVDGGCDIF
jgi:hypothetical protein